MSTSLFGPRMLDSLSSDYPSQSDRSALPTILITGPSRASVHHASTPSIGMSYSHSPSQHSSKSTCSSKSSLNDVSQDPHFCTSPSLSRLWLYKAVDSLQDGQKTWSAMMSHHVSHPGQGGCPHFLHFGSLSVPITSHPSLPESLRRSIGRWCEGRRWPSRRLYPTPCPRLASSQPRTGRTLASQGSRPRGIR